MTMTTKTTGRDIAHEILSQCPPGFLAMFPQPHELNAVRAAIGARLPELFNMGIAGRAILESVVEALRLNSTGIASDHIWSDWSRVQTLLDRAGEYKEVQKLKAAADARVADAEKQLRAARIACDNAELEASKLTVKFCRLQSDAAELEKLESDPLHGVAIKAARAKR